MGRDPRDELVRIDRTGQAHPIGPTAAANLRQREGAYRLLPAPQHVVFMRYTGEDGRRDEEDGRVVRLAGEVTSPGALCDIFALLGQTGWRGEAVVLERDIQRSVYFEQGNVVGAHSTADGERLGALLYRFGAITASQLEELIGSGEQESRLGGQTVKRGLLTQDKVYEYLRKQVEEIVFATLTISDGTYFFLDGFDDHVLTIRHALSANSLLMDAVTRMDEMRYFREKIPSEHHIPVLRPVAGPVPEQQAWLLDAIDGKRSVTTLGRITGKGEHAITKELFSLVRSGHVAILPPALDGGLQALVELANDALRRVHERVDGQGDGHAFRQALAAYVAGAGVHDLMFRGAGPAEDGTFDSERVVSNVEALAGGTAEQHLRQQLHDYLSFVMFSAGAELGTRAETELNAESTRVAVLLQPLG